MTEKNLKEKNPEEDEASFFYALGHKIRREMIQIIGKDGFSTFTILKKELKVSTGTIYHHLETLSQLIEQKKDKKYYLTDLGIHALESMKMNIKTIKEGPGAKKEFDSPLIKGLMALTPKRLFSHKENERLLVVLISSLILFLGAILCGLNGFFSFLLFFNSALDNGAPLELSFQVLISLSFIINTFIYFMIIEGICRSAYNKNENTKKFFISFSISFFPMVIFLIIHFIFQSFNLLTITIINFLDNILMIFFQLWSLWLLSYNMTINKDLRMENSLIISLLLHYGGFTLLFIILL